MIAALEAATESEVTVVIRTPARVAATLAAHGGNVSSAARELGVSRDTVRRKAKAAKLDKGRAAAEWSSED